MKAAIYILGYLLRHGSLHGYKLKELIDKSSSDFAAIKLPTLYYHLEQLERKGYVSSTTQQKGRRPERTVYSISKSGEKHFIKMLEKALAKDYQSEFLMDAVFFFGDSIPLEKLIRRLSNKLNFLEVAYQDHRDGKEDLIGRFAENNRVMAKAIYNHHEYHYIAEISWLKETLKNLQDFISTRGNENETTLSNNP